MKTLKILSLVAVSLALSLGFVSSASASPTTLPFQADNLYLAGSATCAPIVRDFNGDGWADIATGGADHWDLLLGGGKVVLPSGKVDKGQFATTPSHPSNGCPVAAVDFNRDGRLDIATSGGSTAQIWLGNGDGSFAAPVSFDTGSRSLQAVADLNGDRWPDLVLAGRAARDHNVGIRYGNALGFGPEQKVAVNTYDIPSDPSDPNLVNQARVADINGDRRPDLIVGSYAYAYSNYVVTLVNRGRTASGYAAFTQTPYKGAYTNPGNFVASDFNEDGIRDLLVSSSDIQSPARVDLALGNGDGTFGAFTVLGGHGYAARVPAIGDFDRDGHRDVAYGTSETHPFSMRFGNGDGSFEPELFGTRSAPITWTNLARINANHDGRPDIVAVDASSGHTGVILYFNTLR